MPGPTGLDRRPTSIHGVSRGPATLTYHPQRAHAARLAAEKACGHTGVCEKKMLQVGAARWLCSGHRSEGSACLGSYHRGLLTPARSAGLPPTARETGQHWPRRRHFTPTRRRWPAVMTPREGVLRAAEAVAAHRAADGAVPSIQGARKYVCGISRGAVVGFPACRSSCRPFALPYL
jgi:hypothetical protein